MTSCWGKPNILQWYCQVGEVILGLQGSINTFSWSELTRFFSTCISFHTQDKKQIYMCCRGQDLLDCMLYSNSVWRPATSIICQLHLLSAAERCVTWSFMNGSPSQKRTSASKLKILLHTAEWWREAQDLRSKKNKVEALIELYLDSFVEFISCGSSSCLELQH